MAFLVMGLTDALNRQFGLKEYFVWSTVMSVLLIMPVMPLIQLGYLVAIFNSLILILFGKLTMHRNHLIAILVLAAFSLIGASRSATPITGIISEMLGITVLSGYYFYALTNVGPTITQWVELYMRAALAVAVLGLIIWLITIVLHIGDGRLKSLYSEPSFYVYVTLPALGYCVNCFAASRRYGWEALIFLLSYALADSSLGFAGVFLVLLLAFARHFKGWRVVVGTILLVGLMVGVYFASLNVRIRADLMARAVVTQDLSNSGPSPFAFLSNFYVASQSFLAHPMTGTGIGGYATAYDTYISDVTGTGLDDIISMKLNREDANSMFFRVAAELGLPGLVALLGFLIVCARVRGSPYVKIRNALLPYLLVRFGRLGAYFTAELYFFVGLYLLNYLHYRASLRTNESSVSYSVENTVC